MAEARIELIADVKRYLAGLREARKGTKGLTGELKKQDYQMKKNTKSAGALGGAMRSLKVAAAGIGFAFLARGFIQNASAMEQLQIRLKTFTGSLPAANREWARLTKVAAQTHVDVDELISSYITLRQVGIDPTTESTKLLADFSAATGRSMTQLSNIIFKGTKSTELFTEAGIQAETVGDKLRLTYNGVTTEIDKTSAGIYEYIQQITVANGYTGTSAEFANGLTGALSNLSGNFKLLAAEIGKTSGFTQALADIIAYVANGIAKLEENIRVTGSVFGSLSTEVQIVTIYLATFLTALAATKVYAGVLLIVRGFKLLRLEMLKNPLLILPTLIATAIVLTLQHFKAFELGIDFALAGIRDKWEDFKDAISKPFEFDLTFPTFDGIKSGAQDYVDKAKSFFKSESEEDDDSGSGGFFERFNPFAKASGAGDTAGSQAATREQLGLNSTLADSLKAKLTGAQDSTLVKLLETQQKLLETQNKALLLYNNRASQFKQGLRDLVKAADEAFDSLDIDWGPDGSIQDWSFDWAKFFGEAKDAVKAGDESAGGFLDGFADKITSKNLDYIIDIRAGLAKDIVDALTDSKTVAAVGKAFGNLFKSAFKVFTDDPVKFLEGTLFATALSVALLKPIKTIKYIGKQIAILFGKAIALTKIPVGNVFSGGGATAGGKGVDSTLLELRKQTVILNKIALRAGAGVATGTAATATAGTAAATTTWRSKMLSTLGKAGPIAAAVALAAYGTIEAVNLWTKVNDSVDARRAEREAAPEGASDVDDLIKVNDNALATARSQLQQEVIANGNSAAAQDILADIRKLEGEGKELLIRLIEALKRSDLLGTRPSVQKQATALGLNTGGPVSGPGGPRSDSILAKLSDGEYVINAESAAKLGIPFLDSINKYANGGLVGYQTGGQVGAGGQIGGFSDSFLDFLGSLEGASSGLAEKLIEMRDTINESAEAGENVTFRTAVYNKHLKTLTEQYDQATTAATATGEAIANSFFTEDQVKQIAGDLSSGIVGIISGTSNESIGSVFKKAAQKYLAKQLEASLNDLFTAVLDSVKTTGPGGSAGSGGFLSSILGAFIGMNSGGIVPGTGNTDTVPTLLTPGELVVPKGQAAGYGGTTINVTNYITAPLGVDENVSKFIAKETEKTIASNPDLVSTSNNVQARRNRTFGGG